jgi:periplasmic protein TonB
MIALEERYKKHGIVATILLHLLLFLLLFFFTITTPDPPFPQQEVEILMDFTGSSSAGGGEESAAPVIDPKPTPTQSDSSEEPTDTQEDSPVVKPSKTSPTKTEKPAGKEEKPKYEFGFGGGGQGDGQGDKTGEGTDKGDGLGVSGPGNTGLIGNLSSGRSITFTPNVPNPVQEEGIVKVEVHINRDGKVVKATHVGGTTNNPEQVRVALQKAFEFKYSSSSSAKELEKTTISIKFSLN